MALASRSSSTAVSLEERIRNDIVAGIRRGDWAVGERIPYEHELTAEYGCARATVSKALTSLARAGLIERRRKAGSFVARPHAESAVLEIPDIEAVIAANGGGYRFEVLRSREQGGSAAFASGAPVLAIEGVHHDCHGPFAFEAREINVKAVPQARRVDFSAISPGAWLLRHIPWTEAQHRISAINADRELERALKIAPNSACLQIERTTWRNRTSITHVRQIFPGDRYDLVAKFSPTGR